MILSLHIKFTSTLWLPTAYEMITHGIEKLFNLILMEFSLEPFFVDFRGVIHLLFPLFFSGEVELSLRNDTPVSPQAKREALT